MGVKARVGATEIAVHAALGHVQVYDVKVILVVESSNASTGDVMAPAATNGNLQPSVGLVAKGNL